MNKTSSPPKKILVVDDEAVIRRLVSRVLVSGDYDLTMACSVDEGRNWIQSRQFDLLLTDLRLPDGNGTDVIRQFRAKFPSTPVLVMTGSLTPEERLAQVAHLGSFKCIQKPFELSILQNAIDEAFGAWDGGR